MSGKIEIEVGFVVARFQAFVFWRFDECRHWSSPLQRSSDITGRNSIVDSV